MSRCLAVYGAALLLISVQGHAHASDQVAATSTWSNPEFALLNFFNDDRPIRFTEHTVELTFKDPRHQGEIEKILLDPMYRPDSNYADFWLDTTITSPLSKKRVSESSECNWNIQANKEKSIASCIIEDDGGRVVVVMENRSDTLKKAKLGLLILRLDGYSGFRLATDGQHSINVKLKSESPVISPIKF
jgi:hypothetical protein